MQVSIDKQLKDRDKEWENKLVTKEAEYNKARLFEKVRERALLNLTDRNPILPQDTRKAQMWRETYLNELRKFNYMENGEGLVVLNEDGTTLTSPHGKAITFDEFERDIADKYFEYPKAEDRTSPGNKDDKNIKSVPGMPKTEDEYFARLKDLKITPKERIELTEFWTNKNLK
jgi:hypothetical protein